MQYRFEEVQHLQLAVYDIDNESPSLEDDDFLQVANTICSESHIIDSSHLYKLMFASPHTSTPNQQAPQEPFSLKDLQLQFVNKILKLHEKEACGVPLLAVFVAHLVEKLEEKLE